MFVSGRCLGVAGVRFGKISLHGTCGFLNFPKAKTQICVGLMAPLGACLLGICSCAGEDLFIDVRAKAKPERTPEVVDVAMKSMPDPCQIACETREDPPRTGHRQACR